jgi:NAD(P)-dependent dehydrogenase (short-subunit alcohol dehydrogenase family)
MDLKGKKALVTGAAVRLGRECALALARKGADVALHCNNSTDEAKITAEEITNLGVRAVVVRGDLSDPTEAVRVYKEARSALGPIDVLVHSASVFPSSRLENSEPEDFALCSRIHTVSPLMMTREMAREKRPGVVIHFLDSRITDWDREHLPYHLSKRELFTLTRALSLELAPLIRVNGIAPGLILPPPGRDPSWLEDKKGSNPLQSVGNPEQIVSTLLFLIDNDYVTGQVVFVDGGRHLRGSVYGL